MNAPETAPRPASPHPISPRSLYFSYAAGLFSMGQSELLTMVIPLWALLQGASPAEIGMLVGSRSALTFFLAIHGGALLDRLGTRRVMLFFTAMTGLLAACYPFLPWLPVMVFLQIMIGYTSNMTWIGAQTIIAEVAEGDPGRIGQFSFYARIGNVIAPLLMGFLWDTAGPRLSFLGVACWSVTMFLSVSRIDAPKSGAGTGKVNWRDMLPKLSDYTGSLNLVFLPVVAFTLAISFTRHATNAAESSFLIVYLKQVGFAGTAIGTMFSIAEVVNGFGSLTSGRIARLFPMPLVMIILTAASIILLSLTPQMGGSFILLTIAHSLRRTFEGIVQPLMFSLQARAVPRNLQGSIVGLRVTNNRLASIVTPVVMGFIVEWFGLAAGFAAMGVILCTGCVALGVVVWRSKSFNI